VKQKLIRESLKTKYSFFKELIPIYFPKLFVFLKKTNPSILQQHTAGSLKRKPNASVFCHAGFPKLPFWKPKLRGLKIGSKKIGRGKCPTWKTISTKD